MQTQSDSSEKQGTTPSVERRSSTEVSNSEPGAEDDAVRNTAVLTADEEHPHGARPAAIVVSLMLCMFLVALDNVSHLFRRGLPHF